MAKAKFKFEESLKRLEEIVRTLESGEQDLEASIQLFEEGMQLTHGCEEHLQALEVRVKLLVEKENGELAETDFQKSAAS
jgi:exodeoxyribonuclease VII small subunit